MVAQVIKQSPNGSFKLTKLCESVVICESPNDPHGWGNETNFDPAFLVYLGCRKDEVADYVRIFNTYYRCQWCEVRKPKYLTSFEAEIKIRGMQRYSDTSAFGLDYLLESQTDHVNNINFDEYNSYCADSISDYSGEIDIIEDDFDYEEEYQILAEKFAEILAKKHLQEEKITPSCSDEVLHPDSRRYHFLFKKGEKALIHS